MMIRVVLFGLLTAVGALLAALAHAVWLTLPEVAARVPWRDMLPFLAFGGLFAAAVLASSGRGP